MLNPPKPGKRKKIYFYITLLKAIKVTQDEHKSNKKHKHWR